MNLSVVNLAYALGTIHFTQIMYRYAQRKGWQKIMYTCYGYERIGGNVSEL